MAAHAQALLTLLGNPAHPPRYVGIAVAAVTIAVVYPEQKAATETLYLASSKFRKQLSLLHLRKVGVGARLEVVVATIEVGKTIGLAVVNIDELDTAGVVVRIAVIEVLDVDEVEGSELEVVLVIVPPSALTTA